MKTKILTIASAVVTLLALFSASTACIWFAYQPREPKCLR